MFFWLTLTDIACVYPICSGVEMYPRYCLFLGLTMCTLSLTCDSHRQEQREYVMKSIELQTVGDGSPVKNHQQKPRWSVTCSACLDLLNIFEDLLQDLSIGVMNIKREHLAFFNAVHVKVVEQKYPVNESVCSQILQPWNSTPFCFHCFVLRKDHCCGKDLPSTNPGDSSIKRHESFETELRELRILTLKIQHVGKNL